MVLRNHDMMTFCELLITQLHNMQKILDQGEEHGIAIHILIFHHVYQRGYEIACIM